MKFINRVTIALFAFVVCQTLHAQPSHDLQQAEYYKVNSKIDSALVYYQKAADGFKALGKMEDFINASNQLGTLLTRLDRYDEAKRILGEALTANGQLPDSESLLISGTYITLGVIAAAEERFSESLEFHYKALNIRLAKLGEDHADSATSYGNIGNVNFRSKNYEMAVETHLKAMKIRIKLFGANGVEVIQSYTNLGNAYRELGNYSQSLKYFEKALETKTNQPGTDHKALNRYYANISDVYYLMKNTSQGDFYKAKAATTP